jgi:hypothetical protein
MNGQAGAGHITLTGVAPIVLDVPEESLEEFFQ